LSVQGLVNINDFNDAKTIELFETVIEMFTYPCDVDFERDTPVQPQDELSVMGFAMDPHVMRCTYAASQTQVRTHARTHTHAHAHTHTHTHTHTRTHTRACTRARARTHTTHAHAGVQHGLFERKRSRLRQSL